MTAAAEYLDEQRQAADSAEAPTAEGTSCMFYILSV
jgi:hypothetical protein